MPASPFIYNTLGDDFTSIYEFCLSKHIMHFEITNFLPRDENFGFILILNFSKLSDILWSKRVHDF